MPRPLAWTATLAVVLLLGIPHGALDGEVARPLLRPRFGRAWFLAFAVPYLSLSAAVLLAWRAAPEAVLAGFLAASVLHFGEEDAGPGRPLELLVRGGLSIALPVLLHPAATARVFEAAMLAPMPAIPPWLQAAALAWAVLAPFAVARMIAAGRWPVAVEGLLLGLAFAALPPLAGFALYFVGLHAPRHTASLAADPRRAPRVRSTGEALWRSLPVTALTLLIGAALWPFFPGAPPERLLALTLQGLAALTLPHLLLDGIAARVAPPVGGASRHRPPR
ncbi:hypothetical protein EAH89_06535 [Roseomonas nepalensis]|uniref:Probable beta-carotene 15,15'-dioxygenase n=2 Tax=Muricoccus nepalensis TaxID=1854500 RepID=A0A502GEQ5_9PROT|nr:hypothetical protein EAH89_06535 [Roseomonas nepalensis]